MAAPAILTTPAPLAGLDSQGNALRAKHYTGVMAGMVIDVATAKPFIIPVAGLAIGAGMMSIDKVPGIARNLGSSGTTQVKDVGKLVLYFGAQSFMNVYMSWLMRKCVVVEAGQIPQGATEPLDEDLTGIPAGFALTALQQVISFVMFLLYFAVTYFTPYKYVPKKLTTGFEQFTVILFGLVFCMNIALNNFSLSLISIAVNLIIRSCLPLSTFLSQQLLAMCNLFPLKPCRILEVSLMVIGVTCAGIFTWSEAQAKAAEAAEKGGSAESAKEQGQLILGVLVCLASLLCGSLNLALAGVLGTSVHLNPMDTVAYMAVPATLFLLPVIFFLKKPVPGSWPQALGGASSLTDWEILMGVWRLSPRVMSFGFLSGVFSFLYNIIQFTIVQTLSPSATAFGGNFNKAALIFLSYIFLDPLPSAPWGGIIIAAVVGNIIAFSFYTYLQIKAKEEAKKGAEAVKHQELEEEDDDDESDEGDDEDSEESGGLC